jgi:hypothetical protein
VNCVEVGEADEFAFEEEVDLAGGTVALLPTMSSALLYTLLMSLRHFSPTQADFAKSTCLAAASHDLRQPAHAMGLFFGAVCNVLMAAGRANIFLGYDGQYGSLEESSAVTGGVVFMW